MPLEGTLSDPISAPGAPADPAPTAPTSTPVTPPSAGPDPTDPVDVASLPANVQHLIADLRKRAGAARTTAKAKAADEARTELLGQISQALGLQEAPADPAALADQLASTRLAEASARLELDVYRTAQRMGVDGERLLDSRRFADAVDALPDEGFDAALKQLITEWADKDPSLRGGGPAPVGRRPVENLRSGALPAGNSVAFDPDAWIRQQAGVS